jgi:preprotein translocase SecE subunit
MKSFATYLKNVRAEMAHVVWPGQRTAVSHVILILIISTITALLITALDLFFREVLSLFV